MHLSLLRRVPWAEFLASYPLLRNHVSHVASSNVVEFAQMERIKKVNCQKFNLYPSIFPVRTNLIRMFASTVKSGEPRKTKITKGPKLPTSLPPVRIRRVGVADAENVSRFVRLQAQQFLPTLDSQASGWRIVLEDYVQRGLAQGCSLVAARPGTVAPRGLALSSRTCPWDALLLRRWAGCMRASGARNLVRLAAHCLAAPDLHLKYGVVNVFQVWLLVQPDLGVEVSTALATRAMSFAKDLGFKVIRMDCCTSDTIQAMHKLKFKKEWEMAYKDYVATNGSEMFGTNLPHSHYAVYVNQL